MAWKGGNLRVGFVIWRDPAKTPSSRSVLQRPTWPGPATRQRYLRGVAVPERQVRHAGGVAVLQVPLQFEGARLLASQADRVGGVAIPVTHHWPAGRRVAIPERQVRHAGGVAVLQVPLHFEGARLLASQADRVGGVAIPVTHHWPAGRRVAIPERQVRHARGVAVLQEPLDLQAIRRMASYADRVGTVAIPVADHGPARTRVTEAERDVADARGVRVLQHPLNLVLA